MAQSEAVYRIVNLDRECEIASSVQVAGTSATRRSGFSDRSERKESAGLWLAPCEAVHTFGLKMPIDIVFLDRRRRALKLVKNLAPSRIALCLAGDSVLELESGSIQRCGLQRGDRLEFQSLRHC